MELIVNILKFPILILRKMYDWTLHWARTSNATYALFGIAFIESSFFPIPPDVLLIAMVVADSRKWFRYATICTIGSVCGALFGYWIGLGLYETVGRLIIEAYKLQPMMELVGKKYAENAFFTVFIAAFTPIPYKVITIAAGVFRISLSILIIASIIGRAGRFFLVAVSLRIFGNKIQKVVEKYFDVFSIIFVVLLIGGYFLIKYVFKQH